MAGEQVTSSSTGWTTFGLDEEAAPFRVVSSSNHSRSRKSNSSSRKSLSTRSPTPSSRSSSSRRRHSWMNAPISGEAITPLAPPPPPSNHISKSTGGKSRGKNTPPAVKPADGSPSPTSGSARSRARWTSKVSTSSLRSPKSKRASRDARKLPVRSDILPPSPKKPASPRKKDIGNYIKLEPTRSHENQQEEANNTTSDTTSSSSGSSSNERNNRNSKGAMMMNKTIEGDVETREPKQEQRKKQQGSNKKSERTRPSNNNNHPVSSPRGQHQARRQQSSSNNNSSEVHRNSNHDTSFIQHKHDSKRAVPPLSPSSKRHKETTAKVQERGRPAIPVSPTSSRPRRRDSSRSLERRPPKGTTTSSAHSLPDTAQRQQRESIARPRATSRGREATRSTRVRSASQPRAGGGGTSQRAVNSSSTSSVTSQPRAVATSGRAVSTSSVGRGRTSSRSTHPPLTKDNHHRRARSRARSASLTRVSNRGNVSPSMRGHRPQSSAAYHHRARPEIRSSSGGNPTRGRSISHDEGRQYYDPNIGIDISFDDENSPRGCLLDFRNGRKTCLIEKLFGNQVERKTQQNHFAGTLGYEIRPRVLLAATVYHNTATNLWITTINTNQRGVAKNPATANKFLKAFSFPTENEARESAIANAPPKMVPFNESPICFICKGKFAVFRRAGHCRNCGVCVCSNCCLNWPAKMIPATYNLKNEAQVRVCRSCDSLSCSFKKALIDGDLEEAIALYGTGNINLRTPFPVANKKDELMHPIHCAVEGGNINMLRWLIDDHYCPIKIHRAANSKKTGRSANSNNVDTPILTSKGRSVLTIAMDSMKVDILRYLVVDCGVSIYEARDLKAALRALEAALVAMPPPANNAYIRPETPGSTRWDYASFDDFSEPSSLGADDYVTEESMTVRSGRSRTSSRNGDSCIICCDRKIDCVCTPCGHQVCCLECSKNLTLCPVCNDKGNFIKIFRP